MKLAQKPMKVSLSLWLKSLIKLSIFTANGMDKMKKTLLMMNRILKKLILPLPGNDLRVGHYRI